MKILADENCEREMVDGLGRAGHDVVTILDLAPSMDDEAVFKLAGDEDRILLTNDHDFGLIAEHAMARPPAVILMRLDRLSFPRRMEILLQTLAELSNDVSDQFIVLEPHQIRARVYEP
jgi:predicted nuclease of predicted toxin-antitoxin system